MKSRAEQTINKWGMLCLICVVHDQVISSHTSAEEGVMNKQTWHGFSCLTLKDIHLLFKVVLVHYSMNWNSLGLWWMQCHSFFCPIVITMGLLFSSLFSKLFGNTITWHDMTWMGSHKHGHVHVSNGCDCDMNTCDMLMMIVCMFWMCIGKKEVRVLILGLDNAGKTTILCNNHSTSV